MSPSGASVRARALWLALAAALVLHAAGESLPPAIKRPAPKDKLGTSLPPSPPPESLSAAGASPPPPSPSPPPSPPLSSPEALLVSTLAPTPPAPLLPPADGGGWTVLWEDTFDGSTLDYSKWDVQVGRGCQYGGNSDMCGWGNGELQFYADRPQNLRVEGGNLVITAMYEDAPTLFPKSSPPDPHYTSARIRTFRRYAARPSAAYPTLRVEARMRAPQGSGLWPAFWLLPEDGATASCSGCGRYGVWAASGEIDVAELANDMTQVTGAIHFGGSWPDNAHIVHNKSSAAPLSDGWHTYSIELEQTQIRWYLDGEQYGQSSSSGGAESPASGGWYSLPADEPHAPFGTQAFHLLLNLAIGGPGTQYTKQVPEAQVRAGLATPKSLLVDYVRVSGRPAR
eukprot:scaffold20.g7793.t1